MDTRTPAKIANPRQIYHGLKRYIDAAANFVEASLSDTVLSSGDISGRVIRLAVPEATDTAQWAQLQAAVEYAASKGVELVIERTN